MEQEVRTCTELVKGMIADDFVTVMRPEVNGQSLCDRS